MNYTYLTRFSCDYHENVLFLDLIRTNLFRVMSPNKPSLWQSFRIPWTTAYFTFTFGHLVTADISSRHRRLYIFGFANNTIHTTWVPLGRDGYVEVKKGSDLPSNLGSIPISAEKQTRNPKITELNHRRVLLSWEEHGIPHGMIGTVGENGAIPEADRWKKVVLKFEVPIVESMSQSFASVLVPHNFE